MKMSESSLALVGFLHQHGPMGVDELLQRHAVEGRTALHKRLNNLVANGWLQRAVRGDVSQWSVRPGARARVALLLKPDAAPASASVADSVSASPPAAVPAAKAPWVGPVVPPRQIDVMRRETYWPATPAPARPGALDFKALPSRGFHG